MCKVCNENKRTEVQYVMLRASLRRNDRKFSSEEFTNINNRKKWKLKNTLIALKELNWHVTKYRHLLLKFLSQNWEGIRIYRISEFDKRNLCFEKLFHLVQHCIVGCDEYMDSNQNIQICVALTQKIKS